MSMRRPIKRDPEKPPATPASTDPSRRGGSGGDRRNISTATGPAASKGTYTPTADPGEEPAEDGSPADFFAQQHGSDDEVDGSK